MNSRLNWRQFKVFFLVNSLLALLLAANSKISTAGAVTINIKDTNYPIPSGAYFVSPDGSTSNSGKSVGSPTTVAKAISSAPEGSTIVFRGGTYRNIDTIAILKKLTLQAYPHEQAWIKGSIVVDGWVKDGNDWRKDGWNYSFPPDIGSEYIDPNYPMAGYRDMVYINGVALNQVGSRAEVSAGTFYVDPANNRLYVGDNPAGKTVEATTASQAFSLWKGTKYDPSGTVIKGLGFAHFANYGLSDGALAVKLEDNTFVWNAVMGAYFRGAGSADAIVRGNTFSYNGRKGLGGHYAHRMLLENNTISYNNIEHFTTETDAAGAKITQAEGLVWRNNLVEHNFANGLWVDGSATNATIVKNISRYNDESGIFFEVSHGAIIAANVVSKNGYAGIMVSTSAGAKVYNNTLVDNIVNIVVKDSSRRNTNQEEIDEGITWIPRNNIIKNNILSNTGGGALLQASNCSTKEQSSLMIDAADYNGYYRKSSNSPKYILKWSLGGSACATNYNSIADFKSVSGYEQHALAIDNQAANPFFVDEQNANYSLKPGSPAIGRGVALPKDIAKAIGWQSQSSVDLGALQSL